MVSTANGHSWTFPDLVQRGIYGTCTTMRTVVFIKHQKFIMIRSNHLGRPFFYYAYGAAVSEVAIDTLTGEMKVLRADILHDVRAVN